MGLTIGGNGLGGMIGRIVASLITDALSWRYAIGAVGLLGLVATFVFFWPVIMADTSSRSFTIWACSATFCSITCKA